MKRFELEQAIMSSWTIVDDLRLFYDNTDGIDEDTVQNVLLGLIQLAEWKHQKLFKKFEEYIEEKK